MGSAGCGRSERGDELVGRAVDTIAMRAEELRRGERASRAPQVRLREYGVVEPERILFVRHR